MTEKFIIAGFGGQGVILAGKLLAYGGMVDGLRVSHIPSYGVEMRGGTANCSVIISDKELPAWGSVRHMVPPHSPESIFGINVSLSSALPK